MAEPLAELMVEMGVTGQAALSDALAGIHTQLTSLNNAVISLGAVFQRTMNAIAAQAATAASSVASSVSTMAAAMSQSGQGNTFGQSSAMLANMVKGGGGLAYMGPPLTALAAPITKVQMGLQKVHDVLGLLKPQMEQVSAFGTKMGLAFGVLSGVTMGWVHAGLAGTVQGERLNLMFGVLSREIASIFLPTIRAVTEAVQAVGQWFRNLDPATAKMIERFVLAGAAGLLVTSVLAKIGPLVLSVMTAVITASIGIVTAIANISAGMTVLDVLTGGIIPIIGSLVTLAAVLGGVGTAFVVSTSYGQNSLMELGKELWKTLQLLGEIASQSGIFELMAVAVRLLTEEVKKLNAALALLKEAMEVTSYVDAFINPGTALAKYLVTQGIGLFKGKKEEAAATGREHVALSGGTFENVTDSFRRIQSAILKTGEGEDPAKKQLDESQKQTELLKSINKNIGGLDLGLA